jgi:hypothetical protein
MKIRILKAFYLVLILSTYGCGTELFESKWKISSLYAQKIEGTSKILYKYDAWGGLDANASGFIILDSTVNFKIDLKNELPFYYLSAIPNKLNIEGVTHECYNSCGEDYAKSKPIFTPMKTGNHTDNTINILTRTFQYRGFSEKRVGLERYVFSEFIETKDSLIFYNLEDIESLNGIHLKELRIKKGEIYLEKDKNLEMKKLRVYEVKLNTKTSEIESLRTIDLKPLKKIMASEISERGIFRQLEIPK